MSSQYLAKNIYNAITLESVFSKFYYISMPLNLGISLEIIDRKLYDINPNYGDLNGADNSSFTGPWKYFLPSR
jgi:hypothetical protein